MTLPGGVTQALRQSRRAMRRVIARFPALYLPWVRSRRRDFDGSVKAVGPDTEIVIEGFPRCGNSFAFAAFRLAQERETHIAHHLHAPAQVLAAVRTGIPTLVLIRAPEDAVASLMVRDPWISPAGALQDYVGFYTPLVEHAQGFVVADFSEVTTDFGGVLRRVNARFGTRFREFEHSPANVKRCFDLLEQIHGMVRARDRDFEAGVARPSADRERRKEAARDRLSDPRLEKLRAAARDLYDRFRGFA